MVGVTCIDIRVTTSTNGTIPKLSYNVEPAVSTRKSYMSGMFPFDSDRSLATVKPLTEFTH